MPGFIRATSSGCILPRGAEGLYGDVKLPLKISVSMERISGVRRQIISCPYNELRPHDACTGDANTGGPARRGAEPFTRN